MQSREMTQSRSVVVLHEVFPAAGAAGRLRCWYCCLLLLLLLPRSSLFLLLLIVLGLVVVVVLSRLFGSDVNPTFFSGG